jgi:hypothetical protein
VKTQELLSLSFSSPSTSSKLELKYENVSVPTDVRTRICNQGIWDNIGMGYNGTVGTRRKLMVRMKMGGED